MVGVPGFDEAHRDSRGFVFGLRPGFDCFRQIEAHADDGEGERGEGKAHSPGCAVRVGGAREERQRGAVHRQVVYVLVLAVAGRIVRVRPVDRGQEVHHIGCVAASDSDERHGHREGLHRQRTGRAARTRVDQIHVGDGELIALVEGVARGAGDRERCARLSGAVHRDSGDGPRSSSVGVEVLLFKDVEGFELPHRPFLEGFGDRIRRLEQRSHRRVDRVGLHGRGDQCSPFLRQVASCLLQQARAGLIEKHDRGGIGAERAHDLRSIVLRKQGRAGIPFVGQLHASRSQVLLADFFLGALGLDRGFVIVPLEVDAEGLVQRDRGRNAIDALRVVSESVSDGELLREFDLDRGADGPRLLVVFFPVVIEVFGNLQSVLEIAQHLHGDPRGVQE